MKGYEAAAYAAMDADVELVTGVPGSPTTSVMEFLMGKMQADWSVNEKVAVEMALGASSEGRRAMAIMKHVGLNVASDPLITAGTKGVGGGLVVLVGDDPGGRSSQNEQDSRFYGPLIEGPMLDPSSPRILYKAIKEVFHLSEEVGVPAIVRYTERVGEMDEEIERTKDRFKRVVYEPMWNLTRVGRHQRLHGTREPRLRRAAEESTLNRITEEEGCVGVISSGYPSSLVPPDMSHLALTYVHPLPRGLIESFVEKYDRVLVVEETEPYLESAIPGSLGRLTGHLPRTGPTIAEDIRWALGHIDSDYVDRPMVEEEIKKEIRGLCDNCPFIPLYRVLKDIDVSVAADLGCMVLSAYPPYSIVDASYALGSAIALASGFEDKGIALIGDHGFIHSGVPSLLNALAHSHDVLIILLDNKAAAMTGGQQAVVDATNVIMQLYPEADVLSAKDADEVDLRELVLKRLGESGVSVVVLQGQCDR